MKLSVAIATFNEGENIGRSLRAVKDIADEIIVVDGTSTDDTVKIAEKFGAQVTVTNNPPIFHINKQKAIDACRGDWILQLDSDEEVPKKLADEIREISQRGSDFNAFWIKRRNFFLGHWLRKGGQYPDPVIRFFRKGKAQLPCKSVHEQMVVEGKVGWLQNDMFHFTSPSFTHYLIHANLYTSLTAKELQAEGLKLNFFNYLNYFFIKPTGAFFSLFFRHSGFQDGFPGFCFALFSGWHYTLAFIKYWEIIRQKNKQP